jgi:hypothetical protein
MKGISRRALLSAAIMTPVATMAQTPAPPDAYLRKTANASKADSGSVLDCATWASRAPTLDP